MNRTPTREEALFADALARPPAERGAFLAQACGSDVDLLAHLVALVAAHESPEHLTSPGDLVPSGVRLEETPGNAIGRYRLLEKLGEGGCGAVWAAEQREPVKRRVALKIIKLGMDTQQVIARFEAERQALALMDHPNIAKMLDAGATETGRPYFVMELVRGIPITAYCDENHLTTAQRLELLIKVCHAIQHAHQKGIIHRDIKPSNVLITLHDGVPVPKVIDFGIAKATQQELTEKTIYTRFQQFIGTPAYMSPEQAEMSGLDIDTRSDIYSLGVLLYELVTGRTPFDSREMQRQGVDEIRRTIREKEPPRPSTRLGTLQGEDLTTTARRRSTDPRKLAASVRGDLDWIAMKCLEKDRTRRYETANGLGMDVQRYLAHEPVVARPPSAWYRTRKFVRRHRMGFAAGVMMAGVILVGSLATTAQAVRALRAERTQNELRESARVAEETAAAARRAAEEQAQRLTQERWARQTALPEIERLLQLQEVMAAFKLALDVEKVLPTDPALTALWPRLAQTVSLETNPSGAAIYLKLYRASDAEWQHVGYSPLKEVRIAREAYRLQVRKDGYALMDRIVSANTSTQTALALVPLNEVPPDMVRIPGGPARPRGLEPVRVKSFLMDQYEVTNRRFKEFVDTGGYGNRRFWRQPFLNDGKEIAESDAMNVFRDATGRAGPSTWRNGEYPVGQDDFPVTGISWFEAAAYAEFVSKRLPSIYHWSRAASGWPELIAMASNFAGRGPAKVGAYKGMSTFGVFDLAGNAKEWCWNPTEGGKRYALGGASDEAAYMFTNHTEALSPFDRSASNGFRCIIALEEEDDRRVDDAVFVRRPDHAAHEPVSDETYRTYRSLFAYDRTDLKARVEGDDVEGEAWRVQRVSFDTGYGGERMSALLFLPKHREPPYQSVVFFPGSGVMSNQRSRQMIRPEFAEFIVRSGRAFVYPIYQATHERSSGRAFADQLESQNTFRDIVVQWSKDLGRTIDYLETRADIRPDKLAYVGFSLGGAMGFILPAMEPRLRAAVLVSAGVFVSEVLPEVAQINHAPRITAPTLLISGRFDFLFPEPGQRHLFKHLGTPSADKRHVLVDSGHTIRSELVEVEIQAWLDRYLGAVK